MLQQMLQIVRAMVVLFLLIVAAMHLVMHHPPLGLIGKTGEKGGCD
jgi:hypothetical protein